jgi:hypothetical protein
MESKQADTFRRTTPINDRDSNTSISSLLFFNWIKLAYVEVTEALLIHYAQLLTFLLLPNDQEVTLLSHYTRTGFESPQELRLLIVVSSASSDDK